MSNENQNSEVPPSEEPETPTNAAKTEAQQKDTDPAQKSAPAACDKVKAFMKEKGMSDQQIKASFIAAAAIVLLLFASLFLGSGGPPSDGQLKKIMESTMAEQRKAREAQLAAMGMPSTDDMIPKTEITNLQVKSSSEQENGQWRYDVLATFSVSMDDQKQTLETPMTLMLEKGDSGWRILDGSKLMSF